MNEDYRAFTKLLKQELIPAVGCTEPIAIAYCTAKAREVLGTRPERYTVYCSGNVIKNAKSVVVPGTGGLVGIETAVLAGGISGDHTRGLEVLPVLSSKELEELKDGIDKKLVQVELLQSTHVLHIIVECYAAGTESASVEIVDYHTNIGKVTKNGVIIQNEVIVSSEAGKLDVSKLSIAGIVNYATKIKIEDVKDLIEKQIKYNSAISIEGLNHRWGACVGATVKKFNDTFYGSIIAATAAASDARMGGCMLPVVINSGSGNQGLTVSLPVILYAEHREIPRDRLVRALCISNLINIYIKSGIGNLSAYCGVVSAAASSVAGIAFLDRADLEMIR